MEVALVGKGIGRELAPKKGEGVPLWGCNDVIAAIECDVSFWMDKGKLDQTLKDKLASTSANASGIPMYCTQHFEDVPTSIPYPLREVTEFFGTDYFQDSSCFMIALAIYQGFDVISLYGFNYSWGTTYVYEKPGTMFWLGVAMGRGIKVNVYGEKSELFDTKDKLIYAYNTPQTVGKLNLKMADYPLPEEKIKLSVRDRVVLLGMIPQKGTYATLKFARRLKNTLFFNEEEQKKLVLKNIGTDAAPNLIWNQNHNIPNLEIEMTKAEQSIISNHLMRMEKAGELTKDSMQLYEKFCLNDKYNNDMD